MVTSLPNPIEGIVEVFVGSSVPYLIMWRIFEEFEKSAYIRNIIRSICQ